MFLGIFAVGEGVPFWVTSRDQNGTPFEADAAPTYVVRRADSADFTSQVANGTMTQCTHANFGGADSAVYEGEEDTTGWTAGQYVVYIESVVAGVTKPEMRTFQLLAANSSLADLFTLLRRTLGLSKENMYMDETTFDSDGNMTSARIRTYTTHGFTPGTTSPLATYTLTATFDSDGQLETWELERIP
jgi:hypothetical protein